MYSTSIFNKELTELSYNYQINKEFTLANIKNSSHKDSKLWIMETITSKVLRLIPLFNCEKITSSNASDIIIQDNKGVICLNNNGTILECTSTVKDDCNYREISFHPFIVPDKAVDGLLPVQCIVYSEDNVSVVYNRVDVYINNTYTDTVRTNEDGVCTYNVKEPCTIKFKFNNEFSNSLTVTNTYFE